MYQKQSPHSTPRPIGPVAKTIRSVTPLLLGLLLVVTWFTSARDAGKSYVEDAFVLLALFILIFFADSLEVAYSLLRYKLPEQFGGAEVRILREMRDDEDLVYEAREWLVTAAIVVVTLLCEFKRISLPFLGEIGPLRIPGVLEIQATTLFSVLFTTVPVLWLAQGPSKRIARGCPQNMLSGTGALVWILIKAVGRVTREAGLDKPSEVVSGLLQKIPQFSPDLHLRPSDSAFYLGSLQRYGYGLHRLSVNILIDDSGACTVTQRFLYYAISSPRSSFVRRMSFTSLGDPNSFQLLQLLGFKGKVVNEADFDKSGNIVFRELDDIFEHGNADTSVKFRHVDVGLSCQCDVDGANRNQLNYRLDTGTPLPKGDFGFAVLAEHHSSWKARAFEVAEGSEESFYMNFAYPCGAFSAQINLVPSSQFEIVGISGDARISDDHHEGESQRIRNSICIDPPGVHSELPYPLAGATYTLKWQFRRIRPKEANGESAKISPVVKDEKQVRNPNRRNRPSRPIAWTLLALAGLLLVRRSYKDA